MDISIVITTYNYAAFIEDCISSCLAQISTTLDYEVIVVDDGSTDQTPELLNKLTSPRLRKFRIDNSGIEMASNYGFRAANGRFVGRVDADDILMPSFLQKLEPHLDDNFGFYYSDYNVIARDGCIVDEMLLPEFDIEEVFKRGDFLATGTVYSSGLLKKHGYYLERIKNSGLENYELILRLLNSGIRGKHVDGKLFGYRRHSGNLSDTKLDEIMSNGRKLFSEMGYGKYGVNCYHPYLKKVEAH